MSHLDEREPSGGSIQAPAAGTDPAAVELLATTRQAEARLLAAVDALLPPGLTDLSALSAPVRIIVPSTSLRRHVLGRLVAARGAALVGVVVQTLAGLVAELLAALGVRMRDGEPLLPVLVGRFAKDAPGLGTDLGGLDDGLQVAVAPVAALLDAGFDARRDAVGLAELLQQAPGGDAERLRALGLVQVAGQVHQELARLGLSRRADATRRAADLLQRRPDLLPGRAWLLHGFVDPAPADLALLEVLARLPGARCFVVDPALADRQAPGDIGHAPTDEERRLADRLAGGRPLRVDREGDPAGSLDLAAAPGRVAEARHCARRLRALLDAGARPEDIGVVARDLHAWAAILRPELDRLGIPLSGVGARAPAGPAQRRLGALSTLLSQGRAVTVDRWLDAAVRLPDSGRVPVEDLRLAMHSLGLSRLSDVAALDVARVLGDASGLSLPSRSGIADDDDGDVRVRRHRLPRFALQGAVDAAQALLARLEDHRARTLGDQVARVSSLVADTLGWADPDAAWRALQAATKRLVDRIGPDLPLDDHDLRLLLDPALRGAGAGALGGDGGGVQVLSAIEARGRSFSHLFVLGLSRGEFPRSPKPDPLLSDALRDRIADLLPDLVRRRDRMRQERALFGHLLGSAAHVHLSWPASDDDGRLVPVSPLVEALRLSRPDLAVDRVTVPGARVDPPPDLLDLPRPPVEHALRAAQYGPDGDLAVALAGLATGSNPGAAEAARARADVRRELDAPPGALGLGPYLGLVGPMAGRDPRDGPVAVTTLERVATCGWQAFLSNVLRVEAAPAASADLPAVDQRLVGIAVHAVLDRIVRDTTDLDDETPSLEQALDRSPAAVPWPAAGALDGLVDTLAERVAREEGVGLPGLWRLLARRVRPYLDVARAVDWAADPPQVLAVELEGQVQVSVDGQARVIGFRADRADRTADGRVVVTDYKTGKPLSTLKTPSKRDDKIFDALASGQRLQAALYARAAGPGSVGRYLSLKPDVVDDSDACRQARLPPDSMDEDAVMARLSLVLDRVLRAWVQGGLVPRLVDDRGDVPAACGWCGVRAACLQGDSTARQRLLVWAEGTARGPAGPAAARDLWGIADEADAALDDSDGEDAR